MPEFLKMVSFFRQRFCIYRVALVVMSVDRNYVDKYAGDRENVQVKSFNHHTHN